MDEEALTVLRWLVAHESRPGVEIPTTVAQQLFIDANLDVETCLLGLAKAAVRGWLISKQTSTVQVTADGVEAAKRSLN